MSAVIAQLSDACSNGQHYYYSAAVMVQPSMCQRIESTLVVACWNLAYLVDDLHVGSLPLPLEIKTVSQKCE